MEEEIWKDIKGYEGFYQISNYGRVKSLPRFDNCNRLVKEKILTPFKNKKKYYWTTLCKDNKRENIAVHRLVVLHFITEDVDTTKYHIHHKDENTFNNYVRNLEIISKDKHNKIHAMEKSTPILQYDVNGNLIKEWSSIYGASIALGISRTPIKTSIKNNHAYRGWIWKKKV